MTLLTAYHQLGLFIVRFQHLEDSINNLMELTGEGDSESIRILANELEYGKRLNTADVLFARFVDLRTEHGSNAKADFHSLMVDLRKLGERRNELVHSRYHPWRDIEGAEGLLRINSQLHGKEGVRKEHEEELQPNAFDSDLSRLRARAKII